MRKIFLFVLVSIVLTNIMYAQNSCDNPHVINEIPFFESGLSTEGKGNYYNSSHACESDAMDNEEYVFAISPETNMQINVGLFNTSILNDSFIPTATIGLYVVKNCPDSNDAECIAYMDHYVYDPFVLDVDLSAGNNYYIIVSSSGPMFGSNETNVEFDIEVNQNYPKDVGVVNVNDMQSVCGLTSSEEVSCDIVNFGSEEANNFQVGIIINNQEPYYETFESTIPPGEIASFQFEQTFDFSDIGKHNITVFTNLSGDEDNSNDTAYAYFYNTPIISNFPYSENFDQMPDNLWIGGGFNSSWELGEPSAASGIDHAASGSYAWVTNLSGNANVENSYLLSPCFDLSAGGVPEISFEIWRSIGIFGNEGNIQYSLDGGRTWEETIESWSSNTQGWRSKNYSISDAADANMLRIKFAYVSAAAANGMAIDNFEIVKSQHSSIFNSKENQITVYPNPAVNYIFVNTNNSENISVNIYSLKGQKLLSKNNISQDSPISLKSLSPGTYYIELITNDRSKLIPITKTSSY